MPDNKTMDHEMELWEREKKQQKNSSQNDEHEK